MLLQEWQSFFSCFSWKEKDWSQSFITAFFFFYTKRPNHTHNCFLKNLYDLRSLYRILGYNLSSNHSVKNHHFMISWSDFLASFAVKTLKLFKEMAAVIYSALIKKEKTIFKYIICNSCSNKRKRQNKFFSVLLAFFFPVTFYRLSSSLIFASQDTSKEFWFLWF